LNGKRRRCSRRRCPIECWRNCGERTHWKRRRTGCRSSSRLLRRWRRHLERRRPFRRRAGGRKHCGKRRSGSLSTCTEAWSCAIPLPFTRLGDQAGKLGRWQRHRPRILRRNRGLEQRGTDTIKLKHWQRRLPTPQNVFQQNRRQRQRLLVRKRSSTKQFWRQVSDHVSNGQRSVR